MHSRYLVNRRFHVKGSGTVKSLNLMSKLFSPGGAKVTAVAWPCVFLRSNVHLSFWDSWVRQVRWGLDLPMSAGAVAMSLSTIIVAANAQLLRRLDLQRAAP